MSTVVPFCQFTVVPSKSAAEVMKTTVNPPQQWLIITRWSFMGLCQYRECCKTFPLSARHPPLTLPPSLSHLSALFSLHLSPRHYISTPPLLTAPLQAPVLLLLLLPPPLTPPIFPSPPSSLISLVNNSTAKHTWVVIVELHMGDLEDKWTIRVEELKTSPRLHYRAGGICRPPGWLKPVCASFPSLPPTAKC